MYVIQWTNAHKQRCWQQHKGEHVANNKNSPPVKPLFCVRIREMYVNVREWCTERALNVFSCEHSVLVAKKHPLLPKDMVRTETHGCNDIVV